jgi:SAM-dependent methyltransferase
MDPPHDTRQTPAMSRFDLPPLVPGIENLFDAVADDYDQSGVDFFVPIAGRLVAEAAPQPGERVLDLGSGRGAATALLAEAVGDAGTVTAIDLSQRMVEHTRAQVPTADVRKDDAAAPDLPDGAFDLATASLLIFFLRDGGAAAARWLRLLAPGGRLALSTFGPVGPLWDALDGLLRPYVPPHLRDPRLVDPDSPYRSVDRFEAMLRDAGAGSVSTTVETIAAPITGADQWLSFSLGTGQRAMWGHVPPEERTALYARAEELIEAERAASGSVTLSQEVRYTIARAA